MSDVKQRVRTQFGRAADAYAVSDVHAQGESLQVLLDEIHLPTGAQALDVATGAGHCALAFAARVRQMTATDLTEQMLGTAARLAAERGVSNFSTRIADVDCLPFPNGAFDLVTCRLAFHHFPDPRSAMAEMTRVLRPGGALGFTDNVVVSDPAAAAFYNDFERLRDPSHHEVLSLGRLVDCIEAAGLHVTFGRRLTKELEFHAWCDRQNVAAPERERLLAMARELPAPLQPLLAPRWADGTLYFTLWEVVLVGEKP